MGNIIQIRLTATTYNSDEVKKTYPTLFKLAWPENDRYIMASQNYGLLELVQTLAEASQFADWSPLAKELIPQIQELTKLTTNLEKFILAWEPKQADALTYQIEDATAALENKAKNLGIFQ